MNDLLIWPLFSQFTFTLDKASCIYPNNWGRNICFLQLRIFVNMCVTLAHHFLLLPWTIYCLVHRWGWGWSSYSRSVPDKITIWIAVKSDFSSVLRRHKQSTKGKRRNTIREVMSVELLSCVKNIYRSSNWWHLHL